MAGVSADNQKALERIRQAIPKYRPDHAYASLLGKDGNDAGAGSADFDFSVERRMMDRVMAPEDRSRIGGSSGAAAKPPISISKPSSTGSSPSASDSAGAGGSAASAGTSNPTLLASMASRLSALETAQRTLRAELVAKEKECMLKDREAAALKRQLVSAVEEAKAARDALAAASSSSSSSSSSSGSAGEAAAAIAAREAGYREEIARLRRVGESQAKASAKVTAESGRLKAQIAAMESFLADYGLVWVGDNGAGSGSGNGDADEEGEGEAGDDSAGTSSSSGGPGVVVDGAEIGSRLDFPTLITKLKQLNALAGEGRTRVVAGKDGAHRLELPPSLPVTLYRDGFMLRRGPFRSWAEADSQTFLADVLDGYFPGELKDDFPTGLTFDIRDRSATLHTDPAAAAAAADSASADFVPFSGQGHTLGATPGAAAPGGTTAAAAAASSSSSSSAGARPESRVCTLASIGGPSLDLAAPMSTDKLLAALPAKSMAGGNVVSVRAGVAATLGVGLPPAAAPAAAASAGKSTGPILVETPLIQELRAKAAEEAATGRPGSSSLSSTDVATLQVRMDSGPSLILKLRADDTIATVRQYVDAHRGGPAASPYELRTAVPVRAYREEGESLRAAGLVPNAVLMVRRLG